MVGLSPLLFITYESEYGRYTLAKNGMKIPARWAWLLQESPAFFVAMSCFYGFGNSANIGAAVNNALLLLFIAHYAQRSFIYPLLIRGGKPIPVGIFISSGLFCTMNGYLQGRYLALCEPYPDDYAKSPAFVIGVVLFVLGMGTNLHSDYILRNLRKPGETGYKIPRGGAFELVSAPNLLGEVLEWAGFAVASQSWPAIAFALWTFANLVPRAIQHHQWYKQRFGEQYPKYRKAVIPFVI